MSDNLHIYSAQYADLSPDERRIEATLALAHEQRTANLIAIWRTGEIRVGDETFGIIAEKRMSLYREIASRLGFEEQS